MALVVPNTIKGAMFPGAFNVEDTSLLKPSISSEFLSGLQKPFVPRLVHVFLIQNKSPN